MKWWRIQGDHGGWHYILLSLIWFVPLYAQFCLSRRKLGRDGIACGQTVGTLRWKSTKSRVKPPWSPCRYNMYWCFFPQLSAAIISYHTSDLLPTLEVMEAAIKLTNRSINSWREKGKEKERKLAGVPSDELVLSRGGQGSKRRNCNSVNNSQPPGMTKVHCGASTQSHYLLCCLWEVLVTNWDAQ